MNSPRRALALAVLVLAALPTPAASASPNMTPLATTPAAATPAAATSQAGATVTLLSGDRVAVIGSGVRITPGPGRERMLFHRRESGGHAVVIPDDALPALAAGQLDAGLFDVTSLIAQGFGDGRRADLPLLVSGPVPAAAVVTKNLARTGITAALLAKKDIRSAWPPVPGRRVWLDNRVRASLDRSVPMVGAPQAWQAGFRGSNVKVAVLDTGYDPAHPDLAVTESKGFTDAGPADVTDRVGHGTHVASTIAGRGSQYTGVAP
ncbi:MAG: S8 family serine peptidase, partial [Kibdelosporangium sp.]